jgi:capsid protein
MMRRLRESRAMEATRPRPMASAPQGPVVPPGSGQSLDATTWGNGSTGYRTRSTASMRDLRDAKPAERAESVRNSRFLRAKLGIVKALYQNTTRYAIGRGLMPSSGCQDEDWARQADELFHQWATRKSFDVREEMTFFEAQKIVMPDVMCDGDAGAVPIRDLEDEPRVQHFPSDLLANAAGESVFQGGNPALKWRDGILRSAVGTPIAYRVVRDPVERITAPSQRAYWDYPARGFWHIGRNDRINANRPLPWIHHGDQSALNILDLNTLEMQAAKLNSYFAAAIKTAGNGIPEGIRELLTREEQTVATQAPGGETTTQGVERSFVELFGAAGIPVLEPGEEMQFFRNDRPSTTFAGFIEYLIADIAIGFGVPVQFAWGLTGLAGPHARLVLQQADWFFQDVADVLVSNYCQPIWEGFVADRMNRGLLRAPAPGTNWRSVQWQGPGSLTIDKGRDGKLYLDMVAGGMARRSAWFEMTGRNGQTELRKVVSEVRYIMDLCREAGVPIEYVLGDRVAPAAGSQDPEELAGAVLEEMRAG